MDLMVFRRNMFFIELKKIKYILRSSHVIFGDSLTTEDISKMMRREKCNPVIPRE